jgi:methionine-rich copper-binding protein CopC
MRKIILSVVVGCMAFLSTPSSSAHVEIVSSFPIQFANVSPIPTEVWIEFSDELQNLDGEILNSIEVIDATGLVVSYEDAIVEAGRITTKVSGQSVAGMFIVKYRVVGKDGHVIEGDYTFNASPEYAEIEPITAVLEKDSNLPVGGILLAVLFAIFLGGIYMRAKNRRS